MSRSPTTYETVSPQNGDQRLPVDSFQTLNIRARVLRHVSQRGYLDIEVVFWACVVPVILGLMTWGLAYWLGSSTCGSRAQLMEMEHSYGALQGCMVKYRGRWLPLESIREVGIGGEP